MNQNRVRSFAISIDPSLTGDRKKNDELRKKSCGTCGYPRAQSGELCGICEEKAIADHAEALRNLDLMLGFAGTPVHSFTHGRYLDSGNPRDRGLMDP